MKFAFKELLNGITVRKIVQCKLAMISIVPLSNSEHLHFDE